MEKAVEAYCQKYNLLTPGMGLLAACSGGPDSLALVNVLLSLQEKYQLRLVVAHFEHGIRGEDSREDARFVRDFCRQHSLPFEMEAASVPQYAAQHHLSEETAARKLRYEFLRRVLKKHGLTYIATAHHANDQAETVLMRILRGTGIDGLGAMRPVSGDIIRPFLGITRREIEQYCSRHGLKPRHDVTNDDPAYTRNYLRLKLIPLLEERFNPQLVSALGRLAEVAAETSSYLWQQAEAEFVRLFREEEGKLVFSAADFLQLAPGMKEAVLRAAWKKAAHTLKEIDYVSLTRMSAFIQQGKTGQRLSLPCRLCLSRSYDKFFLWQQQNEERRQAFSRNVLVPGKTVLPELGLEITASFAESLPEKISADECYLDFAALGQPLVVRSRQNGDVIKLAAGIKKVKKLFIDLKIPREQRECIPVLACGEKIIWLGGLRRSAWALVTADTQQILKLEIRNFKER